MTPSLEEFTKQNPHIPSDIAKAIYPNLIDALLQEEAKTLSLQALAQKLQKNAERVQEYIVNSSDSTLSFLGLSNKQRDNLAMAHIEAELDDNAPAYTFPLTADTIPLRVMPEIAASDDNALSKILAHELCHWLEFGGNGFDIFSHHDRPKPPPYMRNRILSAQLAESRLPAHFTGFTTGALAFGSASFSSFAVPLVALSYMAGKHLHLLSRHALFMNSRYMEQRADLFADKIIPEITYRDVIDRVPMMRPSLEKIEAKPIGRLLALFKEHPSQYTRYRKSERNCPKFLQYKKDHNIPSLLQP